MKTRQQEQVYDFPYGWNKGDTCVMIINKAKKSTCEYTVESYDGRYFGVRSHTGLFIEPLRKDYSIQRKKRLQPWNNRKHRRRKEAE